MKVQPVRRRTSIRKWVTGVSIKSEHGVRVPPHPLDKEGELLYRITQRNQNRHRLDNGPVGAQVLAAVPATNLVDRDAVLMIRQAAALSHSVGTLGVCV